MSFILKYREKPKKRKPGKRKSKRSKKAANTEAGSWQECAEQMNVTLTGHPFLPLVPPKELRAIARMQDKREEMALFTDRAVADCPLIGRIREEYKLFSKDAVMQFGGGYKIAGRRARKASSHLTAMLKEFRKVSLLWDKKQPRRKRSVKKEGKRKTRKRRNVKQENTN